MHSHIHITGFVAVYIFMLAAFTGWVIIGRVPAILHTPLMSGSNFVHGIVVVGGLYALLNAVTDLSLYFLVRVMLPEDTRLLSGCLPCSN
jgi:NAD/NADP transhydrogenase alpha subunit